MNLQPPTGKPRPERVRQDWRSWLVGVLLGTTVGDAAVNILSGDYRWRFVMVVTAVALVLAVSVRLERYPPRSDLVVWATRALLAGAAIAAVLAAFAGPSVASWATTAAALLSIGAVFVPAQPDTRLRLALGVAGIAVAVAAAGLGAAWLADNDRLLGVADITSGMAIAGMGAALLIDNHRLYGVADIAAGVAIAGMGAALLADNDRLGGVAGIASGVALAGLGAAALVYSTRLFGVALIALGVAVAGYGIFVLAETGLRQRLQDRWASLTADPDMPAETSSTDETNTTA